MTPGELDERTGEIEKGAVDHIRRALDGAEVDKGIGIRVRCDNPSHAILDEVKQRDPDLLVMGTLSRGGIAGLLVGNTAEKVLERVDCSLLTVKPEDFVSPVTLK